MQHRQACGFNQGAELQRHTPAFSTVIKHDGNNRRQSLATLLKHPFPKAHEIAQQLKRDPLIRRAFVFEQQVNIKLTARRQPHPKE